MRRDRNSRLIPTDEDLPLVPHPDAPTMYQIQAVKRTFGELEYRPIAYALFEQLEGRPATGMEVESLAADAHCPWGPMHMLQGIAPTKPWEAIEYGEQGDEGPDAIYWLAITSWCAARRVDMPYRYVPPEPRPVPASGDAPPPISTRRRRRRR